MYRDLRLILMVLCGLQNVAATAPAFSEDTWVGATQTDQAYTPPCDCREAGWSSFEHATFNTGIAMGIAVPLYSALLQAAINWLAYYEPGHHPDLNWNSCTRCLKQFLLCRWTRDGGRKAQTDRLVRVMEYGIEETKKDTATSLHSTPPGPQQQNPYLRASPVSSPGHPLKSASSLSAESYTEQSGHDMIALEVDGADTIENLVLDDDFGETDDLEGDDALLSTLAPVVIGLQRRLKAQVARQVTERLQNTLRAERTRERQEMGNDIREQLRPLQEKLDRVKEELCETASKNELQAAENSLGVMRDDLDKLEEKFKILKEKIE